MPVFFIELLLLPGCHLYVRSLQDICQESNALSGICGDIVMCLSGLAKFKSQSKCLMRGSGKGGKIPAISWFVLSEEGAQVNGDSRAIYQLIVVTTELSGLITNYHQCDKRSELSPLPMSSDWAGVSKSRLQNVK